MRLQEKTRPALMTRRPGEDDWTLRSYPDRNGLQRTGERFTATWRDLAERFISSTWRALTESSAPWNAASICQAIDADLQLTRDDFPTEESWNLLRVLGVFGERRERPTVADVLDLARAGGLDLPGGAGDPRAELAAILECENTACGLLNFANELRRLARKARQARRRWRRLIDYIDLPTRSKPVTPIIVRRVRRKAVRL